MMVVVAVMSILFAIGFPAMSRLNRTMKLDGAARTLEGDIHNAVAIASAQRTTYQIVWLSTTSYAVRQVSPVNVIQTRQMPPGVTIAASDTARFFAWGLASPVTVTVANTDGSKALRILANGRVQYN
jgi:Tfp pilus assembly protein FimT